MDYSAIASTAAAEAPQVRKLVKGRVLQDDTDFHCYAAAANIEASPAENFKSLLRIVEDKRILAGAEFVNCHLTLGLKSGRSQIATVLPYQENRSNSDPAIGARVKLLRNMLAGHRTKILTPIVNLYKEADDSLTAYQLTQIEEHGYNSSILGSGDKDLWMVHGLHSNQKTGEIWKGDGYGVTMYKEVGNVKPKLIGKGRSWFFHQMVMGDKADNIPGLPKLSGRLMNLYLPTKKKNPNRADAACGEAKAVAMLKDVTTEVEAFSRVFEAYQDHYGSVGIATERFMEQAYLLWMQRDSKLLDVQTYFNELGFNVKFSDAQKKLLKKYVEMCKVQAKVNG
jgi:hypothetical protein